VSIYGGGMLNISYVICSLVFSAGEGQSENDLNKVVESERERKLKKKALKRPKRKSEEIIRMKNYFIQYE